MKNSQNLVSYSPVKGVYLYFADSMMTDIVDIDVESGIRSIVLSGPNAERNRLSRRIKLRNIFKQFPDVEELVIKEDIVDMLLDLREIQPEALPINFLLPIPGTPLENADTSVLTPSYCMKVLCLARLMVPQSDIRCAAGREVYFKGREKELLSIVDSIFASGYLTADGQGISDTIKTITDAGFTYEIESD